MVINADFEILPIPGYATPKKIQHSWNFKNIVCSIVGYSIVIYDSCTTNISDLLILSCHWMLTASMYITQQSSSAYADMQKDAKFAEVLGYCRDFELETTKYLLRKFVEELSGNKSNIWGISLLMSTMGILVNKK